MENGELYEFGDFSLDVQQHRLTYTDGSGPAPMPEKAFQTLVFLVRNAGNLVSKQELLEAVWPDAAVEENNLDKAVHAIRQVLSEKSSELKYIETVRKHGYRFVANVARRSNGSSTDHAMTSENGLSGILSKSGAHAIVGLDEWNRIDELVRPEPLAASETTDTPLLVGSRIKNPRLATLLLGLVVTVAALALGYAYLEPRPSAATGTRLIAVLPFMPIDTATRDQVFELGLAESLIHHLAPIKGFTIRPLSSVRKYSQIEQDALAAGREQKVDYVVASNYQISNGRIKVTSQLLNVATGNVEDSYAVAADSANLFSGQDSIAKDIGNKILSTLGSQPVELRAKRGTNNEEAYKFYLLAMNLSEERGVQNAMKSLEFLNQAVALDPNYAPAWAAKAHTHRDIASHPGSDQHEQYQRSMEAVSIALAIDPNSSEAYSARCHNVNRYEYDADGAETACRRALELDPNSPTAHKVYANFLYSSGRFDEAIVAIKTAMDIQPVSYRNQQIYALALYYARRYDQAEEHFKRLIELNPNHGHIFVRLIMVLEEQGKEPEAFDYLVRLLIIQKTDSEQLERFRFAYQTGGWRGVSIERIKTAEAAADRTYFQLACSYAKIGDKEKALDYLEKAYQDRSFLIAVLKVEPQLDPLRDDPRFADLVRRVDGK